MRRKQILPILLLCGAALIGCEEVYEPEYNIPDPNLNNAGDAGIGHGRGLTGSWKIRSVMIDDVEVFVGTGGSATLTFTDDGEYSWTVSGDVGHLQCEAPATSCTVSGDYTYTSYSITFNDDDGPDSGNYTFCGNRLIYLDGNVALTFVRTSPTR